MHYMLLIYSDPAGAPAENSPEAFAEFQEWMAYGGALREAGVWISGDPLQSVATATTVRAGEDGEPLFVDGPFAETKEILGGYYVIDVPDLDRALGWAGRCPIVGRGSVEVRPLQPVPERV